ncbi:MAG TPA: hypothetical protein VKS81_11555, partial [Bacteroidota bacterium]|nr:hypothetical protein [Bacteroidota bacterium]
MTRLGDVVNILPAVESLRSYLPDARIYVAVNREYAGLFRSLSGGVEVIECENTQSVSGLITAGREIAKNSYDMALSMSPSFRNAFLTLRTRAAAKIGYFDMFADPAPFLHRCAVEGFGISLGKESAYD